jgi:hypothetical protein
MVIIVFAKAEIDLLIEGACGVPEEDADDISTYLAQRLAGATTTLARTERRQPVAQAVPQIARTHRPRPEADFCGGNRIVSGQLKFGVVRQRL